MSRRGDYFPATSEFLRFASEGRSLGKNPVSRDAIKKVLIADALAGAAISAILLALGDRAWPIVVPLLLALAFFTFFTLLQHQGPLNAGVTSKGIRDLHQALENRRLHKRLHGVAGAFLERASGDWSRIRRALDSPFFAQDPVPVHWREMRDRIEQESNEAMMRMVASASQCEGRCKDYDRWYSRAEEVVSVSQPELGGQIKSLMAEYHVKRDPRIKNAVPHMATIAWELRKLANEVETLPLKDVVSPTLDKPVPTSFDHLLNSIEELKKAEDELDQNQQVSS
jgi:hypothetical protein